MDNETCKRVFEIIYKLFAEPSNGQKLKIVQKKSVNFAQMSVSSYIAFDIKNAKKAQFWLLIEIIFFLFYIFCLNFDSSKMYQIIGSQIKETKNWINVHLNGTKKAFRW